MAVPTTDARLVEYSTNFNTRGVLSPTTYGLTSGQMALYTPLHEAWLDAYNACKIEGGKSPALVAGKNSAKEALLPLARELYSFIQSSLTVSDENKLLMGVTIRKTEPTSQFAPTQSPLLTCLSVTGRTARYKTTDRAFPTSRRRPLNADGVTILSFAGENPPPLGDSGWKLEGQTGKTTFVVQWGDKIEPGTPCWVTAMWYSQKGEYSPACEPVQTYLQIGPVADAA